MSASRWGLSHQCKKKGLAENLSLIRAGCRAFAINISAHLSKELSQTLSPGASLGSAAEVPTSPAVRSSAAAAGLGSKASAEQLCSTGVAVDLGVGDGLADACMALCWIRRQIIYKLVCLMYLFNESSRLGLRGFC